MKKKFIEFIKALYPRAECRYSGKEKKMYIHNMSVKPKQESFDGNFTVKGYTFKIEMQS